MLPVIKADASVQVGPVKLEAGGKFLCTLWPHVRIQVELGGLEACGEDLCVQTRPGGLAGDVEYLSTLSSYLCTGLNWWRKYVYFLTAYLLYLFRPDLVDWRQVERICVLSDSWRGYVYSLTPLLPICVQAGPGGLKSGREDLCTLWPPERICVLSDPLPPILCSGRTWWTWGMWRGSVYSIEIDTLE